MMKLKAFGENILIKPWEIPVNENAIMEAKAVPDELCFGEIVNLPWKPAGQNPIAHHLAIGMKVLIAKDAGEEVEFEGEKFKVIQTSHILCICSDE